MIDVHQTSAICRIKSVLIAEYTHQGDTVFDLACGKVGRFKLGLFYRRSPS
jgi:hypothetical protein